MRNDDAKREDAVVLSDNSTGCADNYQTGNLHRKIYVLNLLRCGRVVYTIRPHTSAFNAQFKEWRKKNADN